MMISECHLAYMLCFVSVTFSYLWDRILILTTTLQSFYNVVQLVGYLEGTGVYSQFKLKN